MSRAQLCKDLLPLERRVVSNCQNPLVYIFDITGSMGNLPRLIFDKMPMVAGQIVEQKYLDKPEISLAAVGDVTCDEGPLQVCDFAKIRDLDPLLKKIWIESGGGGQHYESYEFMAYYYARLYDMQGARLPICLFTGDESFREKLSGTELRKHFGSQHEDIDAATVFEELKQKFNRNVFLLHRFYESHGLNKEIVEQWESVLGRGYVIKLPEDAAVADITLGILALVSGKRSLKNYVEDIKNRPLEMSGKKYKPQSQERIEMVVSALGPLEQVLKTRRNTIKNPKPTKQGRTNKPPNKKKSGGLKI